MSNEKRELTYMMRKGFKLIKYLSEQFPILDGYEATYRDARLVRIIMNMTDEKFDEIVNSSKPD